MAKKQVEVFPDLSSDDDIPAAAAARGGGVEADAKKIMATEVLNPVGVPPPTPSRRGSPQRQLGSNAPHLFMGAPFMKVKQSSTGTAVPLEVMPPMEGVPSGLEYLADVDCLLFNNQSIDIADEVVGVFQASNWHIMNAKGQRLYIAAERKFIRRTCCPSVESRPFNVSILDQSGNTVLKFTRPVTYALCWWGGDSCGSLLSVFDGDDQLLGFVKQKVNPCFTTYEVHDSRNQVILMIKSTKCKCWYKRERNDFEIFREQPTAGSVAGVKERKVMLGKIKKNWSGFSEITSADTFGIKFPQDLEIPIKGVLIGATFLIDFQFLEARNGKCTGCHFLLYTIAGIIFLFMLIVVIMSFGGESIASMTE